MKIGIDIGSTTIKSVVFDDSGNIIHKSYERHFTLITEKTKAIVMVHYAGMVCDMDEFAKISEEYNIPIIEDAAHAMGSKYNGKMTGCNSAYTIYSLQDC